MGLIDKSEEVQFASAGRRAFSKLKIARGAVNSSCCADEEMKKKNSELCKQVKEDEEDKTGGSSRNKTGSSQN